MQPRFRNRSAWLVVAALTTAGGGAYAFLRARPASVATSDGVASGGSSSMGAAAASPEAARRFRLGEQRRWALSFEARLTESRASGLAPTNTTIAGTWVVTVVGAREGEYDVACELVQPKATGGVSGGTVRPEDVAALERRLARRFFVTYRADGAALRVHFPKDVDPGTRNLLQTIATDTQLVRPARAAPQWTATERDGAGGYLAAYRETGPGQLTKTKLKYLDVDGTAGAAHGTKAPAVDVVIDASTRHLTVDSAGALVAFEGGDAVRIALPMGAGAIAMRVSVRLSGLGVSRAEELVGALEQSRAALETGPIVTHALSKEETRARRDRELVDGATYDGLLSAARDPKRDARAIERLAAWLRLHPESVAPVAEAARGGAAKGLFEALGQASTPPAQAALCALAGSALPADARSDALVALMVVERPTRETTRDVRALWDAPDPTVRKAALFVAGTLARSLRSGDAAEVTESAALDDALEAREAKVAGDAAQRAELLAAMGNSAGPSLAALLFAAAADRAAADDVRAAALRALRLYHDDATTAVLSRAIVGDAAPGPRAAAIFAAGFLGVIEPFVEPLTHAALHDAVEAVRSVAVAQLAGHPDASPDIPDTLRLVAEKDPKPGVRRVAREALDRIAPVAPAAPAHHARR